MSPAISAETWKLAERELQEWRTRALRLLLIVVAAAGLPAIGAVVVNAFISGKLSPLLWVYAVVYGGLIALAFLRRLEVTPKAWIFIGLIYAIAVASFARMGLAGSGRLYFVFLPAVAVIFLGPGAGYLCLGLSLGGYAGFAALAQADILGRWMTEAENPLSLGSWIEAGSALAVLVICLAVLLDSFSGRHVLTLATSSKVSTELEKAYKTLKQRVQDRTRELALLNSITAVASGLVDLKEILLVSLEQTLEAFGLEAGGAYTLEEKTETLVMLAHKGLSREFVNNMTRLPLEAALAGRELNLEQPLSWRVEEFPLGELRNYIEAEGIQSVIGVPLLSKGKMVGGFVINSRSDRTLSLEEGSLLIAIGRQIGLAIENARLLESERLGHEEANRRSEVAEGLREILALLNSNSPLQETLDFIITQACRLMKCDASSLFQMESSEGPLRIRAACGLDLECVSTVQLTLGKGAAGRALAWKKPIAVPDTAAFVEGQALGDGQQGEPNPEFAEDLSGLELLIGQGFGAILAVPLVVQGQNYGGITLYYRRPRRFTDEDVQLATSIGSQAALAIENARLRDQAEQSAAFAERARLARELHDSVTQSLYSVTLYAEAAARLLQSGQATEAAGHLRELGTTAREALREMRLLIFELSPPVLEAGTLAEALQVRLDAVEARGGIVVNFRVEGTERLAPRTRREMYQVAQEALNNALKHSKAQSVRISLYHGDGMSRLEIIDDGVGFRKHQAQKSGGAGLRGMRERVERIAGTLSVESDPGSGTKVTVTAPAARQEGPESG
ncbi:MAG TPA: GAF domain-containing sensor histidine kinase [Spirochaetia bacterium]|nr:GAF domain-containing sensor histidine kinase [Spirochaetia bacterium]